MESRHDPLYESSNEDEDYDQEVVNDEESKFEESMISEQIENIYENRKEFLTNIN